MEDGFDEKQLGLGQKLGQGSWAAVYEGVGEDGERTAVKVMPRRDPTGRLTEEQLKNAFEKEVRMLCTVQGDDNIVQLKSFHSDADKYYIVEEMAAGGDVQQLIREKAHITEAEAAHLFRGVISALIRTHEAGICYSDMKPANLLLKHDRDSGEELSVLLADYGCSQWVDRSGPDRHLSKKTGTPVYMAPEVFLGAYGQEVDVWAAGVILFQLLVGRHPLLNLDKLAKSKLPVKELARGVMFCILSRELATQEEPAWHELSPEAQDLLEKVLDKDPATRLTATQILAHPWILQAAAAAADTECHLDCPADWSMEQCISRELEHCYALDPHVSVDFESGSDSDGGLQPLPFVKHVKASLHTHVAGEHLI